MKHAVVVAVLVLSISSTQAENSSAFIEATSWKLVSENIWEKKVVWKSGTQETLTLMRDNLAIFFVARSVCKSRDRLLSLTWKNGDMSAEGVGCDGIPTRPHTRLWNDVIYPLPPGALRSWSVYNGVVTERF